MDSEHSAGKLTIVNSVSIAVLIALTIYAIVIGKSLLLPFVCALVIWYVTVEFTRVIQKSLSFAWPFPFGLAVLLALAITILVIYAFFVMFSHSLMNILHEAPQFQAKLQAFLDWIATKTQRKLEVQNILSTLNIPSLLSTLAYSLTSLAANIVLILIYLMFLIIEYKIFHQKMKRILNTDDRIENFESTLKKIRRDINSYLKIKTWMSLSIGFTTYLILRIMGISTPEFWGILTFLLNYIPNLGSIVAVILTLLAVSVSATSVSALVLVAVLLITAHFLLGNVIEPKFMGASLGLSPLMILFSLSFWGEVWGLIGIFLCVPLMTIITIVLDKFKPTKPVAILLSGA